MKEEDKKNKRKNLNVAIVLMIVIGTVIVMLYKNVKKVNGSANIMPIILFVIFILIITLILDKRKYKRKFIDTKLRKEILKKLFPQFYKEQDILEEEIRQTKLNTPWKSFADEGTLEIKTEENVVKIYKYSTTGLGQYNKEIELENGIMIKFCNELKNQLMQPVYIKSAYKTSFNKYERGLSSVYQTLYDIAGVEGKVPKQEEVIEVENDEFSQYFSVQSNNEIQAKMIVTYEKMENLLELRNYLDRPIEITYINNDIYVWIENMELVKKSFNRLTYNKETYEQLKTIIEELPNIRKLI